MSIIFSFPTNALWNGLFSNDEFVKFTSFMQCVFSKRQFQLFSQNNNNTSNAKNTLFQPPTCYSQLTNYITYYFTIIVLSTIYCCYFIVYFQFIVVVVLKKIMFSLSYFFIVVLFVVFFIAKLATDKWVKSTSYVVFLINIYSAIFIINKTVS